MITVLQFIIFLFLLPYKTTRKVNRLLTSAGKYMCNAENLSGRMAEVP